MRSHRVPVILATIAVTLGAAACGSDESVSSGSLPPATTATPTSSGPSPDTTTVAIPVEIVDVFEAVTFYPACGNEMLDHQGIRWYTLANAVYGTLDPTHQDRADEVLAVEREPSPVMGRQGLMRVVEPGPGDDVGTLVVWADGVARWVSDSGDLDVWLTDDEITYNWVC